MASRLVDPGEGGQSVRFYPHNPNPMNDQKISEKLTELNEKNVELLGLLRKVRELSADIDGVAGEIRALTIGPLPTKPLTPDNE